MKRYLAPLVLSVIWLWPIVALTGCGGHTAATPTHVTAVWVDAINHGDARQACQQVHMPKHSTALQCEAYYAGLSNQLAFFGLMGSYRVVAHSVTVWQEHGVNVARVSVYSTTNKSELLHVRLVEGRHGWKIQVVS